MSINKLKNLWLTTNTAINAAYSFRNDGASLFTGQVDVSGNLVYTPSSNILNKNIVIVNLSTNPGSYTMSYENCGRAHWIIPDPTLSSGVSLPMYIINGTSSRFTIVNTSFVYSVYITKYVAQTSHHVYPNLSRVIDLPNYGADVYWLGPQQSVDIETCSYNNSWNIRECARNKVENVWWKKNRFDDLVGFGGKNPQYTVDVSGNINFTGQLLLNGSSYVPGGDLLPLNNTWTGTNTFQSNILFDNNTVEYTGKQYNSAFATITASGYLYENTVSGRFVNVSTSTGSLNLTLPNIQTTTHGIWFYLLGDTTYDCSVTTYGGQQIFIYGGTITSFTLHKNQAVFLYCLPGNGTTACYWIMNQFSSKSVDRLLVSGNTFSGSNTFTGTNSFTGNNSFTSLPTSSATPTSSTQLITKGFADSTYAPISANNLATNNTWSGTNDFQGTVTLFDYNGFPKNLTNAMTNIDSDPLDADKLYLGGNQSIVIYSLGGTSYSTDIDSSRIVLGTSSTQVRALAASYAFEGGYPVYDGTQSITLNKQFITKGYADGRYEPIGTAAQLAASNAFTSTNSYSIHPHYSGLSAPTSSNQYTPKSYVDSTTSALLSSGNTWAGANNFSQYPTYSGLGSITLGNQFITKTFSDATYAPISSTATINGNNTFTGNNIFNGTLSFANIPSYTGAGVPSLPQDFTTKNYVDGVVATSGGTALLSATNTWTGYNNFNNLPTSSATPSSNYQLTNKLYVDNAIASLSNVVTTDTAQTITATKTFDYASGGLGDAIKVKMNNPVGSGFTFLNSYGEIGYYNGTSVVWKTDKTGAFTGTMSASNLNTGTLPDARLSSSVVKTSGAQTIGGIKTFTSPPVMSGASIDASSIPDTALAAAYVKLLGDQTIDGIKTFTTGPVMDGTNINNLTIPLSAINASIVTTNDNQTISGQKTFSGTNALTGTLNSTGTFNNNSGGIISNSGIYNNLGNQFQKNVITMTTSQTIATTSSGKVINIAPTGVGVTITLPLVDVTNNGYWYILQIGNYDITLATQSPNKFIATNNNSITLKGGQQYRVDAVAGYDWAVGQNMYNNYVDLSTAQTIAGVKTFSSPPVMSGASISSATIPASAINGGVVDTSTNQTIGGTKTFSNRISGSTTQAYITSNSGLTGQKLVTAGTIGADNDLKASSTLTYDQTSDTLNVTKINAGTMVFNNAYAGINMGTNAGLNSNGVAIGYNAGAAFTTSMDANTAIGVNCLDNLSSGNGNVAFGTYAMHGAVSNCTSNTCLGSASGSAIWYNSSYNFAMGESALSNPYMYPDSQIQYLGTTTSATILSIGNSVSSAVPGQFAVLAYVGGAQRQTITEVNLSTNQLTIDAAANIAQNSYILFYNYGTRISGTITTGGTGTTFTIATGQTISAGNYFAYHQTSTLRKYAVVSSYNSGTGQLILTTSITILSSSTWWAFDMNVSPLQGDNLTNNCAFGKYSVANVTSNLTQNTGFGVAALNGQGGTYDNITYLSGSNNTAIGANAGATCTGFSSNNTFVGCDTDVTDRTYNYIHDSTAIGYGVKLTASNQIIIGRTTETTTIPGTVNLGVLKYTSAYGATNINTTTSGTVNLTEADSGEIFTVGTAATGTVTFQLPTNPSNGTTYKFQNLTTSRMASILCGGTNTFVQSNQTTTELRLYPNNYATVELVYNGGVWYAIGGIFDCVRGTKQSFISSGTLLGFGAQTAQACFPFAMGTTITATATLTAPIYGTYLLNNTAATDITLPAILSGMIGHTIVFRKIGTLATVIRVTANATPAGQTVLIQNNTTTSPAGTFTQIMSATQAFGTLVCVSSTQWAIL